MSDSADAGESLTCSECGSDNPAGSSACLACGAELGDDGPLGKIPTPVLAGGVLLVLLIALGLVAKTLYTKSRPASHVRAGLAKLEADPKAAKQEFEAALKYDAKNEQAILGLARVGAATGDEALIKRHAKKAIEVCDDGAVRARIRVAYAFTLLAAESGREANNQAVEAREDDPGTSEINAILGLAALMVEPPQEDDAIDFLTRATEAESKRVSVYRSLAKLLLARKRYLEGVPAAEKATELEPEDVPTWLLLGELRRGAEDTKGYRRALEKVLELEKDNALAHSRLSEIYLDLNDRNKALTHARAAAKHDPENFEARVALGRILLAMNQPTNARTELEKAQALQDTWEVRYLVGKSEILTKAGQAGYRNIQSALKQAPKDKALKYWIEAATLGLEHDLARNVRGDLENLVKRHPKSYELRLLLARSCFDGKNLANQGKAIKEHLGAAMNTIDPARREAPVLLGEYHAQVGEYAEAIAAWDKALQTDPNDKELLYLKGCAAIKARSWDTAVAALKKLRDLDNGFKDVKVKLDEAQQGAFFDKGN